MRAEKESKDEVRASNARFIEKAIRDFVRESPANRLPSFGNEPIFDEPLVGFADGNDPIFQEYKEIIDEFYLTPGEAFEAGLREKGTAIDSAVHLSVISFILPISKATRLSLRRESEVPSLRWNHTRFQGQDFINELSRHLVSLIEERGFQAVAPEIEKSFTFKNNRAGTDFQLVSEAYSLRGRAGHVQPERRFHYAQGNGHALRERRHGHGTTGQPQVL